MKNKITSIILLSISITLYSQSTSLIDNLDSLKFYSVHLEYYSSSMEDVNRYCAEIIKYDGGHEFIVDNVENLHTHETSHEYFLGYFQCISNYKDEKFVLLLKEAIEKNLVPSLLIHILPKLYDDEIKVCEYMDSLIHIHSQNKTDPNSLHQRLLNIKSSEFFKLKDVCH